MSYKSKLPTSTPYPTPISPRPSVRGPPYSPVSAWWYNSLDMGLKLGTGVTPNLIKMFNL